jgi:glycosyltransferase involved in cell wall biosynthesis
MNILHLSTSDIDGGAARAAYRLHIGLLEQGVNSKMFVRDKHIDNGSIIRFKYPKGFKKAEYKIRKNRIENDFFPYKQSRTKEFEVFSDDRSSLKAGFFEQIPDADIYHLHWTSGFVDLPAFFKIISKPVIWTLHDMFPFTGGCHYSSGCQNYFNYCHHCPQLKSSKERDLSFEIWTRKHKAFSGFKNKIIIRADSFWLANEAKKSSLFKDLNIGTIHYGIESDEFIPRDKMACRKALNIPVSSRVIVFGAPGIDNPRKGFKHLSEALLHVNKVFPEIFLLSFGSGQIPLNPKIPVLHLGKVGSNQLLSLIYNCADVFVIPSLQEAFGQTALEAMSCSIPLVGFDTGGIPDMIENGTTGYLAETENIEDLADAIIKILKLNKKDYDRMAMNCREKVLKRFTLDYQAENYINLYNQLYKL